MFKQLKYQVQRIQKLSVVRNCFSLLEALGFAQEGDVIWEVEELSQTEGKTLGMYARTKNGMRFCLEEEAEFFRSHFYFAAEHIEKSLKKLEEIRENLSS